MVLYKFHVPSGVIQGDRLNFANRSLSLKGPHPVEVDQLLINMLLVWNSIFLAKVDQHVDHLINFVDQLLINMLIS